MDEILEQDEIIIPPQPLKWMYSQFKQKNQLKKDKET